MLAATFHRPKSKDFDGRNESPDGFGSNPVFDGGSGGGGGADVTGGDMEHLRPGNIVDATGTAPAPGGVAPAAVAASASDDTKPETFETVEEDEPAVSDTPVEASPKIATASRGLHRGFVGQYIGLKLSFELVVISGTAMMAGAALPQGTGLRPRKSASRGAEAVVLETTHGKHYDWRQLPRWWQLSMYLCIFAHVACVLWDVATLAPSDPGYATFQAFAAVLFGGVTLLLHHMEGRWFAQWHAARGASSSAGGVSEASSQVNRGSWWDRQQIWLITSTGAIIGGAIGGILAAEVAVFASPAAMQGASTSLMMGFYPNVVAFNGSAIGGLALQMGATSAGYAFYHRALPYCLLPTSELPLWLLPLLVFEFLMGWALLMWRFMPYPGHLCMSGFGAGFLWPIHDCYRLMIRGVRLWGLPTMEERVHSAGWLLLLATFPYLYYPFFHALPAVALKAAAGSHEFPSGDFHNFVVNPGMATLRWLEPVLSNNMTRAQLTGIGLFDVLDFPMVPVLSCYFVWVLMPLVMGFFAIRSVDAKTAWTSQRRVWPVQTIITSMCCWITPISLCFDQVVDTGLASVGVPPMLITWIVFILSTELNGFLAGMISRLTEIGSDPSTFEPELPQVVIMSVAVLINYKALLPYTLDTYEFWLTLVLVKLLPIAIDTVPWRAVRMARRQPDTYPSLFFRNFPWEGARFCIVVMQVCEIMVAVFLAAPLVTIRRSGGVGVRGEPSGWIVCNDEPIGGVLARLAVIFVANTTANVAQFFLVGRACERMSRSMANHEHEVSHVLPWPDGKLRSSSDILHGLGWRLIPCLLGSVMFLVFVTARPLLVPFRCDNFPPFANLHDIIFAKLL